MYKSAADITLHFAAQVPRVVSLVMASSVADILTLPTETTDILKACLQRVIKYRWFYPNRCLCLDFIFKSHVWKSHLKKIIIIPKCFYCEYFCIFFLKNWKRFF